jgi:hypothetical protein
MPDDNADTPSLVPVALVALIVGTLAVLIGIIVGIALCTPDPPLHLHHPHTAALRST